MTDSRIPKVHGYPYDPTVLAKARADRQARRLQKAFRRKTRHVRTRG
jgi:hypothetical protein